MGDTRRMYAAASALGLVAATMAGCTAGTKTLTTAAFIAKADAICTTANAALSRVASPPGNAAPAQVVTFTQQQEAIAAPAMARLGALRAAPAVMAVLTRNLVAPEKARDTNIQMLVDNVQEANGDTATEEAALEYFAGSDIDPNQVTENQALATFGFGACAHFGNGGPAGAAAPTTTTMPPATASPTTVPPASSTAPTAFVAVDAGFSAVFPVTPTRQVSPLEDDPVLQMIFYNASAANEDVSVSYALHPSAPTAAEVPAVLTSSVDEAATAIDGTVTSMSPLTYLGSPAEDAVITTPDQVDRIRVVIIGPKFYVLQGFAAVTATAHPEYDELVATFHTT